MDPATIGQFAELFKGREDAWGTGKGAVVRGSLRETHYASHLAGWQPGLGIFPLLDDGTIHFAAVDLDEPNFEVAYTIKELLPGTTFVERSRSGNFHVWSFFDEPIEAWIPRGLMKAAAEATGRTSVEIFPKQDRLLPGMVGNYINLPYHGTERPFVGGGPGAEYSISEFLSLAKRNSAAMWRKRAGILGLNPAKAEGRRRDQGTSPTLHMCAEKIIAEALHGDNPIREGHRHIVFFNLAKQLLDWSEIDDEEAFDYLVEVNEASPEPLRPRDLLRAFTNAKRGGYTSTGCDNPVMSPYVHPDCPIAHGYRAG